MKMPTSPPPFHDLLDEALTTKRDDSEALARIFEQGVLAKGKYRHWDRVRHLDPPEGLTLNEWWLGIKLARDKIQKSIPLRDKKGVPFVYGTPDPVQRALHEITQQASGWIASREQVMNPATRDRYLIRSLIDEAITSSQLEGAATTTRVAKEMLRSGRRPRDRSEQMILNNYLGMRFIQDYTEQPLDPELVLQVHRIVTRDALDDPSKAGTLRDASDDIVVTSPMDGTLLHVPPPAHELGARLERMCAFANGRDDDGFVHPVVRAIILHFWVGYDHPFVDGNGRTARALFYWSMLSQGYWLAQFLSISSILAKAPASYARSYLYTETDGNDLTYFLDYQLGVICRAVAALLRYLDRKTEEVRNVERLIRGAAGFNHRQLALLGHALRHPGTRYTFQSHKRSNGVAYQTARTDLLSLSQSNLLIESRVGRSYQFEAPSDLADRLRRLGIG